MNDLVEIVTEDVLSDQATSEPIVELNKNREPKIPKQENEIFTLEDILDDLRYLTKGYPTAAVKAALAKQDEITPFLFEFLIYAIENYQQLDELYFGHLYAMFLLSYFREKTAFPLIMKITALPEEWPENLLGDTITEDLDRIIASLYDGNITLIQQVIENKNTNIWSRNAALRSLLVLVKNDALEREWAINYFKKLFLENIFLEDEDSMTNLVSTAYDLYPEELYDEIKNAFIIDNVDTFCIRMEDVDALLAEGKEAGLAKNLYDNHHYNFIDNVIETMEWWACFHEEKREFKQFDFDDENDGDDDEFDWDFSEDAEIETYRRESPKIGRNEPCPCGSGKKYKKCCLV